MCYNEKMRKVGFMKKIFNVRNLMLFIFITFIVSAAYVSVRIVSAPTVAPSSEIPVRIKSDYILMLVQCVLGALAMLLPGFLWRVIRLSIPSSMMIIYAVFLYCAIYLGEVRSFYYNVPHWDTVLHTFSGSALGSLGFSLASLLNRSDSILFSLSPVFVAMFAFGFAMSLGVIWEIYEFTVDFFLRTNMQKYALESGEKLTGQAALADSMKDLIVDATGSLLMSVAGYISLKYKKGWLERLQLKIMEGNAD